MQINDILFKIKTALSLDNETIIKAYALTEYEMGKERLANILKRRQDKGYEEATYEELGIFLDGFVILKRGPSPKAKSDEAVALSNNLMLKKLRIALELKEPELVTLFALADVNLTKRQVGSLFRSEGHKNFKSCSDELFIAFLEGLDKAKSFH
ncbi:DUF1456 family protein [Sulfurovum sp. bin170]|uniref:DUF1456 family protein n=1 Tax=Sulfurovum sp. bin170 TaxID=2695268 RepID=UPI0013E0CBBD|nr:DUF1456 family protein [Sulfurovum sp. bin170]NEW60773.1 DUF1456 family protein [Sulfurovum sp. bin170]